MFLIFGFHFMSPCNGLTPSALSAYAAGVRVKPPRPSRSPDFYARAEIGSRKWVGQ